MMTNIADIIRALRCSNAPLTEGHTCDGCAYLHREPIEEHPQIKIRPDVVIDGVGYWESCDYEQIGEDAAQALEELTK